MPLWAADEARNKSHRSLDSKEGLSQEKGRVNEFVRKRCWVIGVAAEEAVVV